MPVQVVKLYGHVPGMNAQHGLLGSERSTTLPIQKAITVSDRTILHLLKDISVTHCSTSGKRSVEAAAGFGDSVHVQQCLTYDTALAVIWG